LILVFTSRLVVHRSWFKRRYSLASVETPTRGGQFRPRVELSHNSGQT
jgi:hypothetical protein